MFMRDSGTNHEYINPIIINELQFKIKQYFN